MWPISSHLSDLIFFSWIWYKVIVFLIIIGRFPHIEDQDVDDGSESESEASDESDPEDSDDSDD